MNQEALAARRENTIREYYTACEEQDWDVISALMHPDVTFQIADNPPTRTVAVLRDRVVGSMASKAVTLMLIRPQLFIHDRRGDRCVVEIAITLERADGRRYAGPGVAVFTFGQDTEIVGYHAFTDEGRFWD